MERVPFRICVTRLVGTSIFRANSAALMSSASNSSAKCSPGWIAASAISMLLVIVHNLHIRWTGCPVRPLETNSPLIVDADTVLAFAVASESLKAIAWQGSKVSDGGGCLDAIQLQAS